MADEELHQRRRGHQGHRASRCIVAARGVDNEAPYFVDMVSQQVGRALPGRHRADSPSVDVFTTLDLNLQRAALDAVRSGLARVDKLLAGRRRSRGRIAQAALIAVDPRTGEILALVGGRSYNQSQYNRVIDQPAPAGVGVQAVRVPRRVRRTRRARGAPTSRPPSLTVDEPTTFDTDDGELWEPKNYGGEYDGEITWRRALAMSRNLGTDPRRRSRRLRHRRRRSGAASASARRRAASRRSRSASSS